MELLSIPLSSIIQYIIIYLLKYLSIGRDLARKVFTLAESSSRPRGKVFTRAESPLLRAGRFRRWAKACCSRREGFGVGRKLPALGGKVSARAERYFYCPKNSFEDID